MTQGTIEKVAEKLKYLESVLAELQPFRRITKAEYQSDRRNSRAVERLLQIAIETALDVARLLIIEERLREPDDAQDEFGSLTEAKLIPEDLGAKLRAARSFRNILVHDYVRVDPERVFEHLQKDCGDLEAYAAHISRFVTGKGSLSE